MMRSFRFYPEGDGATGAVDSTWSEIGVGRLNGIMDGKLFQTLSVHSGMSGSRDMAVTRTALGPALMGVPAQSGDDTLVLGAQSCQGCVGAAQGWDGVREGFPEEETSEKRPEG